MVENKDSQVLGFIRTANILARRFLSLMPFVGDNFDRDISEFKRDKSFCRINAMIFGSG